MSSQSHTEQEPQATTSQEPEGDGSCRLDLESFLKEFHGLENIDQKLRMALEGMRSALAQECSADFRAFWEIRGLCVPLFKESINPALRAHYWTQYRELSQEARRLKELVNQESAFACEQLEKAIVGLEEQVTCLEESRHEPAVLAWPSLSSALDRNREAYLATHGELGLLNAYATRIQSLRKELVQLEIRVRHKNRFFDRLSKLGDRVYPRRKELLQQMSRLFIEDIETFTKLHFSSEEIRRPLHELREEVKLLQAFAKEIHLTSKAFSESRLALSRCWDSLREEGRRRKAFRAEKADVYKANLDALVAELESLGKHIDDPSVGTEVSSRKLDELMRSARGQELGPQERDLVRQKASGVRQQLFVREKEEREERADRQRKLEEKRLSDVKELQERLHHLLEEAPTLEVSVLVGRLEELEHMRSQVELINEEMHEYTRYYTELSDRAVYLQEEERLRKSGEQNELRCVLQERRERRRLLKEEVDRLRRESGGSGFDIGQAIAMREAIDGIRLRLERVDQHIAELEARIAERG